jgi:hypothetical protein
MFNIAAHARFINVAQLRAVHGPTSADRAFRLASERAAEMADRIAAVQSRSRQVSNELFRRQSEPAVKIARLISSLG